MRNDYELFRKSIYDESKRRAKIPYDYYSIRHTWATIARKLGVSVDDIDTCLGHACRSKMAGVYIGEDWSMVDRANRLVLDYVYKKSDSH